MGNHRSSVSESLNISDDDMDSLIEEVSQEIDVDYKTDKTAKINKTEQKVAKQLKLPNFVKPIKSLHDLYHFQSQIGRGASGSVYLTQSKQTSKQYAVKRMPRSDKLNLQSFKHEINNLNLLNHPNIVSLKDAYISNDNYFVVTDFCSGGTLHERIMKMKRFSERDCVAYMKKLLDAVRHIHSKHIVHRDLKLANIVFDNDDMKESKLKIIDFGESELITDPNKKDHHIIGSLCFLPPETNATRTKQDLYAGDMWSVGVIAYSLIEGAFPYGPKDPKRITEHIFKRRLKWNANIPVSDSCKDFIESLLNNDSNKRLTAEQALKHPWITNQATDKNLGDEYFQLLETLTFQNKLQRVMVKAVLNEMSETNKKKVLKQDHDESVDDNSLINIILSSYTPTASRDSKRYSLVLKLAGSKSNEFTDEQLENMDIDVIMEEIDGETDKSPTSPSMDDEISVDVVSEILRCSSKRYDVSKIIQDLSHDGAVPITYRKISGYHQPMVSIQL